MKWIILLFAFGSASAQNLQLHYDLRNTVDPKRAAKNFPTIYFEYWKGTDSGSVLVKLQADLQDERANIGKAYLQASRSLRLYRSLQLNLSYSGGLGLTDPRQYSYTITNSFQTGLTYPFAWKGFYLTPILNARLVTYPKPSLDPILTLYWWKGLANYRIEFSGDFSAWTENKNHGDASTQGEKGKRFVFFAEPQVWFRIIGNLSAGTKINCFYHVLTNEDVFLIYPSIGLRCKL